MGHRNGPLQGETTVPVVVRWGVIQTWKGWVMTDVVGGRLVGIGFGAFAEMSEP